MSDAERELCERIVEAERAHLLAGPPAPPRPVEPQTIHHTELPAAEPGSRLATEWDIYRREVARLLAEGHEGRRVLIEGENIVGICDTEGEVRGVVAERFPMQDVFLKRIRGREPVIRTPTFLYRVRSPAAT